MNSSINASICATTRAPLTTKQIEDAILASIENYQSIRNCLTTYSSQHALDLCEDKEKIPIALRTQIAEIARAQRILLEPALHGFSHSTITPTLVRKLFQSLTEPSILESLLVTLSVSLSISEVGNLAKTELQAIQVLHSMTTTLINHVILNEKHCAELLSDATNLRLDHVFTNYSPLKSLWTNIDVNDEASLHNSKSKKATKKKSNEISTAPSVTATMAKYYSLELYESIRKVVNRTESTQKWFAGFVVSGVALLFQLVCKQSRNFLLSGTANENAISNNRSANNNAASSSNNMVLSVSDRRKLNTRILTWSSLFILKGLGLGWDHCESEAKYSSSACSTLLTAIVQIAKMILEHTSESCQSADLEISLARANNSIGNRDLLIGHFWLHLRDHMLAFLESVTMKAVSTILSKSIEDDIALLDASSRVIIALSLLDPTILVDTSSEQNFNNATQKEETTTTEDLDIVSGTETSCKKGPHKVNDVQNAVTLRTLCLIILSIRYKEANTTTSSIADQVFLYDRIVSVFADLRRIEQLLELISYVPKYFALERRDYEIASADNDSLNLRQLDRIMASLVSSSSSSYDICLASAVNTHFAMTASSALPLCKLLTETSAQSSDNNISEGDGVISMTLICIFSILCRCEERLLLNGSIHFTNITSQVTNEILTYLSKSITSLQTFFTGSYVAGKKGRGGVHTNSQSISGVLLANHITCLCNCFGGMNDLLVAIETSRLTALDESMVDGLRLKSIEFEFYKQLIATAKILAELSTAVANACNSKEVISLYVSQLTSIMKLLRCLCCLHPHFNESKDNDAISCHELAAIVSEVVDNAILQQPYIDIGSSVLISDLFQVAVANYDVFISIDTVLCGQSPSHSQNESSLFRVLDKLLECQGNLVLIENSPIQHLLQFTCQKFGSNIFSTYIESKLSSLLCHNSSSKSAPAPVRRTRSNSIKQQSQVATSAACLDTSMVRDLRIITGFAQVIELTLDVISIGSKFRSVCKHFVSFVSSYETDTDVNRECLNLWWLMIILLSRNLIAMESLPSTSKMSNVIPFDTFCDGTDALIGLFTAFIQVSSQPGHDTALISSSIELARLLIDRLLQSWQPSSLDKTHDNDSHLDIEQSRKRTKREIQISANLVEVEILIRFTLSEVVLNHAQNEVAIFLNRYIHECIRTQFLSVTRNEEIIIKLSEIYSRYCDESQAKSLGGNFIRFFAVENRIYSQLQSCDSLSLTKELQSVVSAISLDSIDEHSILSNANNIRILFSVLNASSKISLRLQENMKVVFIDLFFHLLRLSPSTKEYCEVFSQGLQAIMRHLTASSSSLSCQFVVERYRDSMIGLLRQQRLSKLTLDTLSMVLKEIFSERRSSLDMSRNETFVTSLSVIHQTGQMLLDSMEMVETDSVCDSEVVIARRNNVDIKATNYLSFWSEFLKFLLETKCSIKSPHNKIKTRDGEIGLGGGDFHTISSLVSTVLSQLSALLTKSGIEINSKQESIDSITVEILLTISKLISYKIYFNMFQGIYQQLLNILYLIFLRCESHHKHGINDRTSQLTSYQIIYDISVPRVFMQICRAYCQHANIRAASTTNFSKRVVFSGLITLVLKHFSMRQGLLTQGMFFAVFTILDKCNKEDKQFVFAQLTTTQQFFFRDVLSKYNENYKFIGKA